MNDYPLVSIPSEPLQDDKEGSNVLKPKKLPLMQVKETYMKLAKTLSFSYKPKQALQCLDLAETILNTL